MSINIQRSAQTNAPADWAWYVYTDMANWPEWSHGLEAASAEGAIQLGAKGAVKPKGFPKDKFEVVEFEPGRRFKTKSGPPGVKILIDHLVEPSGAGSVVTETWEISGPLSGTLGKQIAKPVEAGLQDDLARLGQRAEQMAYSASQT